METIENFRPSRDQANYISFERTCQMQYKHMISFNLKHFISILLNFGGKTTLNVILGIILSTCTSDR